MLAEMLPFPARVAATHLHCCGRGAVSTAGLPTLGARTAPSHREPLFRERDNWANRGRSVQEASPATTPARAPPPSRGAALPGAPHTATLRLLPEPGECCGPGSVTECGHKDSLRVSTPTQIQKRTLCTERPTV